MRQDEWYYYMNPIGNTINHFLPFDHGEIKVYVGPPTDVTTDEGKQAKDFTIHFRVEMKEGGE